MAYTRFPYSAKMHRYSKRTNFRRSGEVVDLPQSIWNEVNPDGPIYGADRAELIEYCNANQIDIPKTRANYAKVFGKPPEN